MQSPINPMRSLALTLLRPTPLHHTLPKFSSSLLLLATLGAIHLALAAAASAPAPRPANARANVETRVRAITFQVSRTGALTPIIELDPVDSDGAKITRVTLNNTQELLRRDVRPGDTVIIARKDGVVPILVRVKTESRVTTTAPDGTTTTTPAPCTPPKSCPVCGTPLATGTDSKGAPLLRCPNHDCPAQVKARIAYYASKQCVNIPGLAETMIDRLVTNNLIRTPADLYDLTPKQIATIKGYAAGKTAAHLCDAIAASRRAELWRVLLGLGITDVPTARAKTLAQKYDTLATLAAASEADLAALPGIGEKAAASIIAWLADPANRAIVERIGKHRAAAARASNASVPSASAP